MTRHIEIEEPISLPRYLNQYHKSRILLPLSICYTLLFAAAGSYFYQQAAKEYQRSNVKHELVEPLITLFPFMMGVIFLGYSCYWLMLGVFYKSCTSSAVGSAKDSECQLVEDKEDGVTRIAVESIELMTDPPFCEGNCYGFYVSTRDRSMRRHPVYVSRLLTTPGQSILCSRTFHEYHDLWLEVGRDSPWYQGLAPLLTSDSEQEVSQLSGVFLPIHSVTCGSTIGACPEPFDDLARLQPPLSHCSWVYGYRVLSAKIHGRTAAGFIFTGIMPEAEGCARAFRRLITAHQKQYHWYVMPAGVALQVDAAGNPTNATRIQLSDRGLSDPINKRFHLYFCLRV